MHQFFAPEQFRSAYSECVTMARKKAQKRTAKRVIDTALASLSAGLRRTVVNLRQSFIAYTEDFRLVNESRAELAPKFMKAFAAYQQETGGGFLPFVRLFAPDMPENSRPNADNEGYINHAAWQAANYLKRLADQQARAATTPQQRAQDIANRPVPPTVAVARLVKAIMPLIQPNAEMQIWEALREQLNWPERMVERIRKEAKVIEPLVILREPRGAHTTGNFRLAQVPVREEPQPVAAAG